MTNQAEMVGTNEQANKEQTTPLASVKQKMQKRQLAERHKTKQLQKPWIEQNTIQSESENERVNQQPEEERREDEEQQTEINQQVEEEDNNPASREGIHTVKR